MKLLTIMLAVSACIAVSMYTGLPVANAQQSLKPPPPPPSGCPTCTKTSTYMYNEQSSPLGPLRCNPDCAASSCDCAGTRGCNATGYCVDGDPRFGLRRALLRGAGVMMNGGRQ
jgi:hypothetical protein